jgi:3-hydroxybutyryl-CoA dehydrogenase
MGAGIAQATAQKGYSVRLYDVGPEPLEAAMERITISLKNGVTRGKIPGEESYAVEMNLKTTTSLEEAAQADLVIEAVPEDLDLKKGLFKKLDALCPAETLLASNTSCLSIAALAGVTQRPSQVAGLHFFNPVPLMKLVEVIQASQTDSETVERLVTFAKTLGKTPVVAKDTPGFIVNRVARPFYGEALRLLAENVADPHGDTVETVDGVLRDAGGFRMGPFELMDLIGVDVNFAVSQAVYAATFQEPRYRPHPIQQRMVDAGLLGRKSGEGFYRYE